MAKKKTAPPTVKPIVPTPKWVQLDEKKPLLYRKEAIYTGEHFKLDRNRRGIKFSTPKEALEHWVESIHTLRGLGYDIPLATTHDDWENIRNRLGDVVDGHVMKNDKGKDALFLDVLFRNEKDRDIALKGDVSIGSPDVWSDSNGTEHVYPLRHVAATSAGVIPKLKTWQQIAASFAEGKAMDPKLIEELISILGLTPSEDADDAAKQELVMGAIRSMVEKLNGGGAPPVPEEAEMSEEDDEVPNRSTPGAANSNIGKGGARKVSATVAFDWSKAPPIMVETVGQSRKAQIDALETQNKITPAVAEKLKLSFCGEKAIRLELSHDAKGGEFARAIEFAEMMAKDRPLKRSGRSVFEADDDAVLELSHAEDKKHSLSKQAEKRAEKANK
jgi:hypothetical protein